MQIQPGSKVEEQVPTRLHPVDPIQTQNVAVELREHTEGGMETASKELALNITRFLEVYLFGSFVLARLCVCVD